MSTIGAVIIARDEEGSLPRCLDSLRDLDEVVVYDTGSTDRTLAIAKRLGAVAIQGEAEVPFHFANARNRAQLHATTPWSIAVDCDEVLHKGSVKALRRAIASNPEANAFHVTLEFQAREEGHIISQDALRVWKASEFTWRHRVHNLLVPKGVPSYGYCLEARVRHLPSGARRELRNSQSLKLMKLAIAEDPTHFRLHRHLALAYHDQEEYRECVQSIYRYLNSEHNQDLPPDISEGHSIAARALEAMGLCSEAVKMWDTAAEACPDRREPYWEASRSLAGDSKWPQAIERLEKLLRVPSSAKGKYHLEWEFLWGDAPREALSFCRTQLTNKEARSGRTQGS